MFVTYKGSVLGILQWQWRWVLIFAGIAVVVTALDILGLAQMLRLPTAPLGVLGAAVGIFVSFRTNAGYERWWEGRRIWGQLVNSSRMLCSQVITYIPGESPEAQALRERMVLRHLAWVHALRVSLRGENLMDDVALSRCSTLSQREAMSKAPNVCYWLLDEQLKDLRAAEAFGLTELKQQSIDRTITTLLDVQGGCERIRNTPLPGGYGFIAERLTALFAFMLPLAIVESIGWFSIPITVIVCLSFLLIGEVGRVLENPFSLFWPALPLGQLSTMIEINLKTTAGLSEVPAPVQPNELGIMM